MMHGRSQLHLISQSKTYRKRKCVINCIVALNLQIKNILAPSSADPHKTWSDCKLDIKQCSSDQLETMHGKTFFLILSICFNTWTLLHETTVGVIGMK